MMVRKMTAAAQHRASAPKMVTSASTVLQTGRIYLPARAVRLLVKCRAPHRLSVSGKVIAGVERNV